MTQKQEKTFENAFRELEDLVGQLESGDIPLDESIALYEKGMALVKWCTEKLDSAELRLEKLAGDAEEGFHAESVE